MITPIRHQGVDCLSFKQLDELNGLPKGASFRAFKRVREALREGEDYFYLAASEHAGRIADLRAAGLIYAGSPHLVLVTRSGYARMRGRG